jgi:hypothetical protein
VRRRGLVGREASGGREKKQNGSTEKECKDVTDRGGGCKGATEEGLRAWQRDEESVRARQRDATRGNRQKYIE